MTMRRAGISFVALVIAGCGGSPSTPDAASPDARVDAEPPPPWFQPRPGDARDWDIQLAAPIDLSAPRTMFVIDLWAAVPAATTIDYGDGDPVSVPAGAQAGAIATLHARTPPAVVICRVDTGALELAAPDARKFPGYEANPPDNPTPPKSGSVIGWSVDSPAERFLDVRATSFATYQTLVWKRYDLAEQIGCDGVVGDRIDSRSSEAGFKSPDITQPDLQSLYEATVTQGHMRTMSVGMKDGFELSGLPDELATTADWGLIQHCTEIPDCDTARPFINLHKAVFAIDFLVDKQQGIGTDPMVGCPLEINAMIADGIYKDQALSSTYRYQCVP
jgi:hypothetical protein